jgi:hypothetical protein
MKRRADEPKARQLPASNVQNNSATADKFELPLDLDDILAVAIFDAALRGKRRRFRRRGSARSPR